MSAAIICAGIANHNYYAKKEFQKYKEIHLNLEKTINDGRDEYFNVFHCNTEGLPEDPEFRFFKGPLKQQRESDRGYMNRVVKKFDFYRRDGLVVAQNKKLNLYFTEEDSERKSQEEVVLFSPLYNDDLEEIVADMEVRRHVKDLRFEEYEICKVRPSIFSNKVRFNRKNTYVVP